MTTWTLIALTVWNLHAEKLVIYSHFPDRASCLEWAEDERLHARRFGAERFNSTCIETEKMPLPPSYLHNFYFGSDGRIVR